MLYQLEDQGMLRPSQLAHTLDETDTGDTPHRKIALRAMYADLIAQPIILSTKGYQMVDLSGENPLTRDSRS